MPATKGQVGSYNRTVGVKLDMDDGIRILTPSDVPLQRWAGTETTTSTKVEWLEEDLTPQTDVVSVVTGTGPWTVTVTDTNIFRPGDVLQTVDAASGVQFVIDSVTNATVMVVSAFAGNATAPVVADTLQIVGQYRNEGSDPEEARSVEVTGKYNLTQWGQEKVEATRTQRKRAMYGIADPYDHEVQKKFKELAIRYERSFVHGQRVESSDKKKRFAGGLFYFIQDNAVSGVKANIVTLLNQLIRKTYEDGGTPGTLMVSPAIKELISLNVDPALRRTNRTETTGGYVIDRYMSDFGELEIVPNRHFPKTKGLVLQKEFIKRVVFDRYFHELLAKTGDADKGHIVGESTIKVKNERAHGVLTVTDAT